MDRERLPPGQHWVEQPVVYDIAPVPPLDPGRASLRLFGAVERPADLSLASLSRLPQAQVTCDLHCVTRWSLREVLLEGVSTRTLAELVRPAPDVRWVMAQGREGYTTNVPYEHFLRDESLVALRMSGQPLASEHGAPLRLFIPSLYLWKSAKYLIALEFLGDLRRGIWEEAGYHDRGDPWLEERFREEPRPTGD